MNWYVDLHRGSPRHPPCSYIRPQLAKVQAIDSPDQPQSDSPPRSPSLSNMLSEMSTHSRRIQNRLSLESPRSRSRATARHSSFAGPPSVPSQESILYSLYVFPASSSGVLDRDHRFPRNAFPCPRRSLRRRHHPPPGYSETDPNASFSATLSEMGLCVRGDVPPQLPPPYASLPALPTPVDG
jgi:hypothetical protein